MADRRRNALILLIVAGLLIASALVIVSKKTRLGLDLKGGVQLVYEGKPTAQAKVDDESLSRAIDIMRKRVDKLGVAQPEIQRSGGSEIVVGLPDVSNAARAEKEVGKTAQLYFYDWEPSVIGPDGKPAPTEGTVTGDATRAEGGTLNVACANKGSAYAQVREVLVKQGERVLGRFEGGAYILPGARKVISITAQNAPPGSRLQLVVTYDDGRSDSFDVTVG